MESFLEGLTFPIISETQKCELNAPISKEEALLALKSLQLGKTPGPDGLSCEFFKEFRHLLINPSLEMLNQSFVSGILPRSLREADITLMLEKGKCPEDCSAYRPTAILNQNLKIISEILALRLEKVLPFIVKEDQMGFVKGRSSSQNVIRLINIISLCQTQELDGMVVSLDAEKALTVSNGLTFFLSNTNLTSGKTSLNGLNFHTINPWLLLLPIAIDQTASHFNLSGLPSQVCPFCACSGASGGGNKTGSIIKGHTCW